MRHNRAGHIVAQTMQQYGEPVWQVLKALRAHDDVLAEELDSLRRELGLRGRIGKRKLTKIQFDLPVRIGADFVRALTLRIVETSTASWEFYFGFLLRFVEREGNARVSARHIEDGFNLGKWIDKQRQAYRNEKLLIDRIQALKSVEGWIWDPYEADWREGLDCLKRFVKREEHARVPARHLEDGFKLGSWVGTQRTSYKENSLKPPARIQALKAVKGWDWDPFETDWREGLDYLRRFVKRENHARVPIDHIEDGFRLGGWVNHQRTSYKKNNKSLTSTRIQALNSVKGWIWDSLEADWQDGLDYLKRFVKREKHARVPQRHTEDGFRLGGWVSIQRTSYKNNSLEPPARIQALKSVKGWDWDPFETDWQKAFDYLKRFVKREKHARVPIDHIEDGFGLRTWVNNQRTSYKKKNKSLTPARIQALNSVKGWDWDPREADWQDGLDYLKRFVKREKHARVPKEHIEDGFKLGSWVGTQRTFYKKNSLKPPARVQTLKSVEGWIWDSLEAKWQDGFDYLKRFVKREEHARVPARHLEDGFKLGSWISIQRTSYKKKNKSLTPTRIQALKSVKGWVWDAR